MVRPSFLALRMYIFDESSVASRNFRWARLGWIVTRRSDSRSIILTQLVAKCQKSDPHRLISSRTSRRTDQVGGCGVRGRTFLPVFLSAFFFLGAVPWAKSVAPFSRFFSASPAFSALVFGSFFPVTAFIRS